MRGALDFYFDFMSPFAYLAFQRVPSVCKTYDLQLRLRVVDLPKLKLLAGNTAPPNVNLPLKLAYFRADIERWASIYSVPATFPKTLDTAGLNRALLFALDKGEGLSFTGQAWDQVWGAGRDPADPALLAELAGGHGWQVDEINRWTSSPEAIARYDNGTQQAHDAGVFGTPTMIVGDQMWWGNDRLDIMEAALRKGHS